MCNHDTLHFSWDIKILSSKSTFRYINEVIQRGGGEVVFLCDKYIWLRHRIVTEGVQKKSKFAWRHLWTAPYLTIFYLIWLKANTWFNVPCRPPCERPRRLLIPIFVFRFCTRPTPWDEFVVAVKCPTGLTFSSLTSPNVSTLLSCPWVVPHRRFVLIGLQFR